MCVCPSLFCNKQWPWYISCGTQHHHETLIWPHCLPKTCPIHVQVADMLDDAVSATRMCETLAQQHLAPLAPAASEHNARADLAPVDTPRRPSLKARCMHGQPRLGIRHASLWGVGPTSEAELRGVGPAGPSHCYAAAQARFRHGRAGAATHRPQDQRGAVPKVRRYGLAAEEIILPHVVLEL